MLHPEVGVTVTANVAQSEEAARLQAAGINPLAERDEQEPQQSAAESAAAEPSA
jgi:hypothetical protein